ncbi:hypothetical protein [Chryseobacterium sp. RLHN22]|uniref:hypothetical protein n=1 Tax=Chryseobacterium sp. RLHN22 TaxID=3437885 RepID=UPI003D9B0C0A
MKESVEKGIIKLETASFLNIQEVADEYRLSVSELVNFHNQHCLASELLTLTLPKFVKFVYLPTKYYESRQAQLLKSNNLLLPQTNSKKIYGIQLKFSVSDLTIHYKVNVNRSINGIVEIIKQKTFVNDYEVEHQIEQLSEKAVNAMYPLQLLLNENGSVQQIVNHEEIKRRWDTEVHPELSRYYVGEVAENVIKIMNSHYNKLKDATVFFERNIFFNLFFLPVYRRYFGFNVKQAIHFYFAKINFMATYSVVLSLQKEFTQSNRIALRITGEESSSLFKKGNKKGKIDLLYKFHKESHEVFSITGSVSCFEVDDEHTVNIRFFELINAK